MARRFAVGRSTVKRYLVRRDVEGHVRPKTSPWRPSRIRPADWAAVAAPVLAPTPRPGQVVARDNLSVHHDPEIPGLIDVCECFLIFRPAQT